MIFCDVPQIEEMGSNFQDSLKKIPLNSDICIIDLIDGGSMWPLDNLTNKIIYNIHEGLSNHTGDIFYLCGDCNIVERYNKWCEKITNLYRKITVVPFPFCFFPKPNLVEDFCIEDEELTYSNEEQELYKKLCLKNKTKTFINLTSQPKLLRLLLLNKYYKHQNFEYSFFPWHHGEDFTSISLDDPIVWTEDGQKVKGDVLEDSDTFRDSFELDVPFFLSDSIPIRELTEFSSEWKPGSKDKRFFDDSMPQEVFTSCCDIVTESYYCNDAVFFSEKTLKEIIFRRPFIMLGAKNQYKVFEKLGFELYDEIFDYDFDSAETIKERYEGFCSQIDRYINVPPIEFNEKLKVLTEKIEYNFQLLNQKIIESEIIYEMFDKIHDDKNIFVENSTLDKSFKKVLNILQQYKKELND